MIGITWRIFDIVSNCFQKSETEIHLRNSCNDWDDVRIEGWYVNNKSGKYKYPIKRCNMDAETYVPQTYSENQSTRVTLAINPRPSS
jgi:hypothetical protein